MEYTIEHILKKGCGDDKCVVIPEGVTIIEKEAFEKCESIETVSIPDTVKIIGKYAFRDCKSLRQVYLGDGVEWIRDGAFAGCTQLEEIRWPPQSASVKCVGDAFSDRVREVALFPIFPTIEKKLTVFIKWLLGDRREYDDEKRMIEYVKQHKKAFLDYVINYNYVEAFVKYTEFFYDSAFSLDLLNHAIENSVGKAEITAMLLDYRSAHYSQEMIENATTDEFDLDFDAIPRNVKDYRKLYKVTIPRAGECILSEYRGHEVDIVIPEMIGSTRVIGIGDYTYKNCETVSSIVLPKSIKFVDDWAFSYCNNLEKVLFEHVFELGRGVFKGSNNILTTTYDNLRYLGNEENPYSILLDVVDPLVTELHVHNKCKSIACDSIINFTALRSVDIPDGVEFMSGRLFYNCGNLLFNNFDNACYLGNADNPYLVLVKAKNNAIKSCEIHSSCKFILPNAFYDCRQLEEIVVPESVISIGIFAFVNCHHLTSVCISNKKTKIAVEAFLCCEQLTIKAMRGSYAEQYALCNKIPINYIE